MFSISIDSFIKIMNDGKIIDIRSREKYNNSHIDNAINIPKNELMINPNKYLNKLETYFIYCQHGYSSARISQLLRGYGYKVYNIIGGYEEWILRK